MKDTCVLGVLMLAAATVVGQAQDDTRPMSPAGRSATQIGGDHFDGVKGYVGGRWVEISYGRPIARGRNLFGLDDFVEFLNDGAPVWRAGANVTTRLVTELPLVFGETRLPSGEYTVFIELARDEWTFIVSSLGAQTEGFDEDNPDAVYGAYSYSSDRDVLRMPMRVETAPYSHDQLHWEFLDITPTSGRLAMFWGDQIASVAFTVPD